MSVKETERIASLLSNLYRGHPWLEVTLLETLQTISAKQASAKLFPNGNSIWEILNHLISWRFAVLQRVRGEITNTPENNYFEPQTDISEAAWLNTLKKLDDSQKEWILFLKGCNDGSLEKEYPGNGLTYYEHIHGILQHDAYHLGQIVLLAKYSRLGS